MLFIKKLTFNPFEENTYVLYDDSKEAVIIDPGCSDKKEEELLAAFVSQNQLRPKFILLTHSHIDHILGAYFAKDKYRVPLCNHVIDDQLLRSAEVVARMYGISRFNPATSDKHLEEGDRVKFGEQEMSVIFVPGHAPGHIAFYHEKEKKLLCGDVIFQGSIGRTDLPGGDFDTLIDSIHKKIFKLPDDVTVYPGHGPTTTVGEEKVSNPFCALSLR